MAHVLTYALEFRGRITAVGDAFEKHASAPPCTHTTILRTQGVDARTAYDDCSEEAFLESRLVLDGDDRFSETLDVDFGHGHLLRLRTVGAGSLVDSADEHLRHGTAVLQVVGGAGQFAGATGRIASNFVVSDTGDLTDHQLGVIFLPRVPSPRG
jgi:hypothetical protein